MEDFIIKYEDEEIILTVKPAGIATESHRIGEKDMVSMVRNYRTGKGEANYIGLVHRLDQPVGGLLLFAKTKGAAAKLSSQVQSKKMEKFYQALLLGEIEDEGELTDYLVKDGKKNFSYAAEAGTPGAKKARLKFRRLKTFSTELKEGKEGSADEATEIKGNGEKKDGTGASVSLVEIQLETGRHHQIRVQMAHHGFPLLGDRKYGGDSGYAAYAVAEENSGRDSFSLNLKGPALFASKLKFCHPKTGKWMEFEEEPHF